MQERESYSIQDIPVTNVIADVQQIAISNTAPIDRGEEKETILLPEDPFSTIPDVHEDDMQQSQSWEEISSPSEIGRELSLEERYTVIETMYSEHRSYFFAIAERILKNPEQAEDIVQEVFYRLCSQELREVSHNQLKTYIAKLIAWRSQDSGRRERLIYSRPLSSFQRPDGTNVINETVDSGENVETESEQEALFHAIEIALAQLPEDKRTIFLAKFLHRKNLPYSTLSKFFNKSEKTVKEWNRRSKDKLRTYLTEMGIDADGYQED